VNHIDATALSTFEVSSDGTRFQMNVRGGDGERGSISLPTQCLNELMMTLPGILRLALSNKHRDTSLRLVFPLAKTRIEKTAGKDALIVTSATPDGFEVSFEYNRRQLDELAGAITKIESVLVNPAELARRFD
jgi:hypothetical protein